MSIKVFDFGLVNLMKIIYTLVILYTQIILAI